MRCISTQVIIHQEDCVLFSKNTGLPNVGHYHLTIVKLGVINGGETHAWAQRMDGLQAELAGTQVVFCH